MEHVPLGRSDVTIPQLVFGTSCLGNLYEAISDETKLAICREWFANVSAPVAIDVAGKYGAGLALEVIGRNLRELGVPAENVVISNKLGWLRKPLRGSEPTFEPGAWVGLNHDAELDVSYDGIMACWEQGCELLGEPYRPQLASVHDPDEYLAAAKSPLERQMRFDDILEAYRALAEIKCRGEIAAIGVGAKDWRIIRKIAAEVPLDWVMLANSLTIYRHPKSLVQFTASLAERGVGVINSAVFHAGFLVGGKYFDYRLVSQDYELDQPLFEWRGRFLSVCREWGVSPATACVQFALAQGGVNAVALNTSVPQKIAENVAAVEARLPEEFWQALAASDLIELMPRPLTTDH
jgi:D-threo-aldose 1-dehydrogenase